MGSLVLYWELLITSLSVVCFGLSNLYWSTISDVPLFCSIVPAEIMSTVQSGALLGAPFWSQLVRWMHSTTLLMRSLLGLFLPLFSIVDLEMSNGLMPAARELMMLSRLLIMPGVEWACSADHWGRFVHAHADTQKVYGAARESHN